jgi:hypothetical protein
MGMIEQWMWRLENLEEVQDEGKYNEFAVAQRCYIKIRQGDVDVQ